MTQAVVSSHSQEETRGEYSPQAPSFFTDEVGCLGNIATSSQFHDILRQKAKELNHDEKDLNSLIYNMSHCGEPTGDYLVAHCDCGTRPVKIFRRCNLRTCPDCAQLRKNRIREEYASLFRNINHDPKSKDKLYFITISPEHQDNYKDGAKVLRKTLNKWMRSNYIADKHKGSIYVIETKNTGNGWHVHLHIIYYGRRLSNVFYGVNPKTGKKEQVRKIENSLTGEVKYIGKTTKEPLIDIQDSIIVGLWKKISGGEVSINIKDKYPVRDKETGTIRRWAHINSNPQFALNYMLKYITANKEEFATPEILAEYILGIRHQRLIQKKGFFQGLKPQKRICFCNQCQTRVFYDFDLSISELLGRSSLVNYADSGPPVEAISFEEQIYTLEEQQGLQPIGQTMLRGVHPWK